MSNWKAQSLLTLSALMSCVVYVWAQVPEDARDPNGASIPYPLLHLVHSRDVTRKGATGHLRAHDPYLFYQLGRDLVQRQFKPGQGAYGRAGELSVPLYVNAAKPRAAHGSEARFGRDHANSCGACHSIPFREAGGGQTISSTGGNGRNTPHFFGAGLVEMLCEQTRQKILNRYDTNRNGLIDRAEVQSPRPVRIRPTVGAPIIEYGDLQVGADGVPRLSSVFRVWYLNAAGEIVADAYSLNDPRVVAFDFAMQPFGWGRGRYSLVDGRAVSEGAEASTLRSIYTVAADVHLGLQADDPSQQLNDLRSDGTRATGGGRSLNGARQYNFVDAPDAGRKRATTGLSLDDPDGDGHAGELTEGDVDAAEFYMLHSPAPATRATAESEKGRTLLHAVGCVRCHVENWQLEAADRRQGLTGDRRLFRLDVRSHVGRDGVSRLKGQLVASHRRLSSGAVEPLFGAYLVERIYTDFNHWDIGPNFYERRFDGTLQREHKTAPLWGVGSTAPYGHNGRFPSLDAVIAAHGGAASRARDAYGRLLGDSRRLLLGYLESLILYPTDEIPTDINGDGRRDSNFEVAGQPVGYERFDARFLFAVPPRYRHLAAVNDYEGRPITLYFIENLAETYRLKLDYRLDRDGDGFPDALDPSPDREGVR